MTYSTLVSRKPTIATFHSLYKHLGPSEVITRYHKAQAEWEAECASYRTRIAGFMATLTPEALTACATLLAVGDYEVDVDDCTLIHKAGSISNGKEIAVCPAQCRNRHLLARIREWREAGDEGDHDVVIHRYLTVEGILSL